MRAWPLLPLLLTPLSALGQEPAATDTHALCVKAYKPQYAAKRALSLDLWKAGCDLGRSPEAILKVFPELAATPKGAAGAAPAAEAMPELAPKLAMIGAAVQSGDVAKLYGDAPHAPTALHALEKPKMVSYAIDLQVAGPKSAIAKHGALLLDEPPKDIYLSAERLREKADPKCGNPMTAYKGNGGSSVAKSYAAVEAAAACLPAWLGGRALVNYARLTGLSNYGSPESIGAMNEGLNAHFQQLSARDPKYREQLRSFYDQIRKQDEAMPPTHSKLYKASLAQATGQGPYKNLAPGWLWSLAMKTSGNDPNRAMELIGFCGHDDIMQAELTIPLPAAERVAAMEKRRKELQEEAARVLAHGDKALPQALADLVASVGPEKAVAIKRREIDQLKPEQFAARQERICPFASSSMYLPRSLDEKADVSDALKGRVARAQAPTQGADALPAKYYHVLAGAFGACEMIRKGMLGRIATFIEGRAAWTYRTVRITKEAKLALERREELSTAYADALKRLPKGATPPKEEDYFREALASGLASAPSPLPRKSVDLAKLDGYFLMKEWGYMKGDVATDISMGGNAVAAIGLARFARPAGWSDKRFEDARAKLESYLADWQWTVAEHKAGADFARRHCKEDR